MNPEPRLPTPTPRFARTPACLHAIFGHDTAGVSRVRGANRSNRSRNAVETSFSGASAGGGRTDWRTQNSPLVRVEMVVLLLRRELVVVMVVQASVLAHVVVRAVGGLDDPAGGSRAGPRGRRALVGGEAVVVAGTGVRVGGGHSRGWRRAPQLQPAEQQNAHSFCTVTHWEGGANRTTEGDPAAIRSWFELTSPRIRRKARCWLVIPCDGRSDRPTEHTAANASGRASSERTEEVEATLASYASYRWKGTMGKNGWVGEAASAHSQPAHGGGGEGRRAGGLATHSGGRGYSTAVLRGATQRPTRVYFICIRRWRRRKCTRARLRRRPLAAD